MPFAIPQRTIRRFAIFGALLGLAAAPTPALAWGREGHAVVALIARHYLKPEVRKRVHAILATDPGTLTKHDMPGEADWADVWKYAGGDLEADGRHHRTAKWHYVNLELHRPSMKWACYGHKPLPAGIPASQGTWKSCAPDKIKQFYAELAAPSTSPRERRLALKFLLHLVGDLHQPLHAADNHDAGGNDIRVRGISRHTTTLHHAWDTILVAKLGRNAQRLSKRLIVRIRAVQLQRWRKGTARDWAWQSYRIAKKDAYGKLPKHRRGAIVALGGTYVRQAEKDIALQLSRAGVRLAWLLNRAFSGNQR